MRIVLGKGAYLSTLYLTVKMLPLQGFKSIFFCFHTESKQKKYGEAILLNMYPLAGTNQASQTSDGLDFALKADEV